MFLIAVWGVSLQRIADVLDGERAERWTVASLFELQQILSRVHPILILSAEHAPASAQAQSDSTSDVNANLLLVTLSAAGGIRCLCERAQTRNWIQRALPQTALAVLQLLERREQHGLNVRAEEGRVHPQHRT